MKRHSLKRLLIIGILLMLINDVVQIAIAIRQYRKKLNRKAHKRIIRGLKKKNSVVLITAKGKILPAYGKDLIRLIKSDCSMFSDPERNMEII